MPDLEDVLFRWKQSMEQKKSLVIGDILKEIAIILQEKLSQYVDQEMSKFLIGWLDTFEARHNIKKYRQQGEAEAID